MKRCPECRRDYYDDSLLYCLDDGVKLHEVAAAAAKSRCDPASRQQRSAFESLLKRNNLPDQKL